MLLSEEYLNKITKEMEEDRRLSKVKLEEVVTIKNGKDWKKLEKGDIPVYGSGGEMGVYVDKYSYDKPTVLIPRKGSIENVFYLDKPFWNVDTIFHTEIDESKLMPKYFYYFIEQYDLSKLSDNPTRPSLTQSTLNKLIMDLPPLSLQNKIVKVLDKFQLLLEDTNGLLPEEIEQRQKQYEYYRKKLLTFDIDSDSTHACTHARTIISNLYYDTLHNAAKLVGVETKDKVEWHKLGQIFYTKNGYTPSKNVEEFWNNGNIPWFRMEDIRAKGNILYDSFLHVTENAVKKGGVFKKNSIILATSATIGEHALVKVSFLSNQRFTCFTRKDEFEQELNIEFAYYYFYKIDEWCKNNISLGSFPSIDVTKLLVKKMPIPPLHVQQHVVNVLDKFDTLVNDIKEGLPKEIEQRQKQYEYWREQLLSFNL
jgi:putative type I restriction enzyme specificity protein